MRLTCLIAASCLAASAAAALEVPLTVAEPAGVARTAEPISGGVPLPPGQFKPDASFRLTEGGQEVPLQARPLVVDKDGFLRWVLLDFQTDLGPHESKTFLLTNGKGTAQPASPLKISGEDGTTSIHTGKVVLSIDSHQPFGLFRRVSADGKPVVVGGAVTYTDGMTGKTYAAGPPASVEIEYAGPMRTTVCVKGRFQDPDVNRFQYVARITAWAGKSAVHVKYTICNSNPDHYCYRTLADSSIELKLAAGPTATILGASKPLTAGGRNVALACGLLAGAAGSARATDGDKVLWTSEGGRDQAEGWLAARRTGGNLAVFDLYFPDNPARQLKVDGAALRLSGVITRWDGARDDKGNEKGAPYELKTRLLYDCSHLSSQYLIDFAAPAEAADLSAICRAGREFVYPVAPPAWYQYQTDTSPLGDSGTQADELACYATWGWKYDAGQVPTAPARTYPRYFAGIDNHYEPEEDPLDQLLIMYDRTGSRAYFTNARSWANYWMDLYAWRTDGWRWKDGGVWWYSGPKGSAPQRAADPLAKDRNRNYIPARWAEKFDDFWTPAMVHDTAFVADSKSCYCHNWLLGLVHWYCLTGERDALEAAYDRFEQDYDTQRRAFKKVPGKSDDFSRDFNRSSENAHVIRMVLPKDELATEASDYLAAVYLQRPTREPRGLVNGAVPWRGPPTGGVEAYVGTQGMEALKQSGNALDEKTGKMTDPKTGKSWYILRAPHTWMFPPLSRAMELYYRLTGNEDAMDWTIAFGQGAARVLYQRHGNLTYEKMLVDFPARGVARDWASWVTTPDNKYAEGIKLSGFLARFYPDVCAHGYTLSGEPFLKQRAFDFWNGGSHRHYQTENVQPMDEVAYWVNYVSDHDGQLDYVGRTFYIWAHPRADAAPPAAVGDLRVSRSGDGVLVQFTAPADAGGGKTARYQVKCSDKPLIEYEPFLKRFAEFADDQATNWWMAANVAGEPAPAAAGAVERFNVTGVPAAAKYFAVRTFDDSNNRGAISNVAELK